MGSLLNGDKIVQSQIEFSSMFRDALALPYRDDPVIEALATVVRTTTKVTVYTWLGDVPGMQRWKDERVIGKVAASNYQLTSLRWANGLEVDMDDLEDDNLGLYRPKINQLSNKAKTHKVNLLVDLLISGFATTKYGPGYDGVAFFSASHPNAVGGVYSNLLTATLDDSGAFTTALQQMVSLTDLAGEPAGYYPTHLIHGPATQVIVDQLLSAEYLASGASNTNYKRVTPYMSAKITDGKWFLADLSQPIKPLIWQIRRDIMFRSVGTEGAGANDYETFLRGKLYYGCDGRYAGGYGLPQTVVGSNATT